MENAQNALGCIQALYISEIKSMSNPPQTVKEVVGGISIAMGQSPDWKTSSKIFSQRNFLQILANYDHRNMSDETADALENHIVRKEISVESTANVSKAAASLAQWQIASLNYHKASKIVQPYIDQKSEAVNILNQTIIDLNNLHEEESDIRHAGLQTHFNGQKHIVHYEFQGEDGAPQMIHTEIDPDVDESQQDNELDNYLDPNDNFGQGQGIQNESLYFISNEIKKKDQSKKFVLWETNELRNHWDDKLNSNYKTQNFEKTNNHQWTHEPSAKSVSLIDAQKTKGKSAAPKLPVETGDAFTYVPKKDRQLNNIFLQDHEQSRATNKKAPWSHNTLNKNEKSKKYMIEGRPLFEGAGGHVQNISAGRDRIFYSSNIF
jgi:hypothetical protein